VKGNVQDMRRKKEDMGKRRYGTLTGYTVLSPHISMLKF
jgi:hypothetical protein